KQPWERLRLPGFSPRLVEAGRDLLVAPGNDGKLHFMDELVTGELHLPMAVQNMKLAARAGSSRIVAVGTGTIIGFDLAGIPEQLHASRDMRARFVDDDTLILWRQS